MSAEYDAFFQKAQDAIRAIGDAKLKVAEYNEMLTKLKAEDPCTKGFAEKLDALDSIFEEAKNLVTSGADPAIRAVADAINDLSFFEKRNPSVIRTADIVKNSRANLASMMGAVTGRIDLRQQNNSCQELKDPEQEDKEKKEEPEAKKAEDAAAENPEPKEGDNQSQDDSTPNNTSPEPNNSGQKDASSGTPGISGNNPAPLVRPNKLAEFSSYTYNVTLYMVTPEAYNSYINNFEFPKTGTYIIAQSGGINSNIEPRAITLSGELGPGKPGLDYFIDDVKINTVMPGKMGNTNTVTSNISFKIYEPVGFSFLPRLSRACAELINQSGFLKSSKAQPLPVQMLYIMAIRFYGYDQNGEIVKTSAPGGNGDVYDKFGSYERYFPLVASRMTTKLDGRVTVYNWEARVVNEQLGFGQLYGKLNSKAYIEAASVGEAIGSLQTKNRNSLLGGLNAEQESLVKTDRANIAIEYDVEYEPGSAIPNSLLIDDDEYSKVQAAMSAATKVEEVTPKLSIKAQSIDTKKKKLEIPEGMSVVSVIDQLITKSYYVTRSLNVVNNQRIETKTKENPSPIELKWFAVHPKVTINGWDDTKKYWNIKITYQIKTFSVPYVRTQYVDRKSTYYGPLKFYKYWFTGENTEVLGYEQTFNTLYYIIQPYSTNSDDEAEFSRLGHVPAGPDSNPTGNDTVGKINGGSKINLSVRDSVYNVADQARATMRIMGDPDFLMETVGGSLELARNQTAQNSFDSFYARRGSINPYNGQVFCEIVFYSAEDYSPDGTGLMDINRDLTFYGTPATQKILGNKGIIYQITTCESTLRRGQFHQTIQMLIVPPETLIQRDIPLTGSAKAAGAGRPSTAADPANQTAAVEARTGLRLNSQGRTAPGATADSRQNAAQVEQDKQRAEDAPAGTTVGTGASNSQKPLSSSRGVTPSVTGNPVDNDDATVSGSTNRVAEGGREDTEPVAEPLPGP